MKGKAVSICLLVFAIFASAGCREMGNFSSLQNLIVSYLPPSPRQQVAMAFSHDDPDKRREGVVLLSRESWGPERPHLEGYALLSKGDDNAMVRGAAVRALGKAGQAKYLPDIVACLSDASAMVRWDAAVALDQVIGEAAVRPLQEHAVTDASDDVRMACIKALRHYRRSEVVRTLLECMEAPAFGVRYQARASLVELTGYDFGCEADDWADLTAGPLPPKPFVLPSQFAKPAKPWWNFLGLTRKRHRSGVKPESEKPAEVAMGRPVPIESLGAKNVIEADLTKPLPPTGLPIVEPQTGSISCPVNEKEYE